MRYSVGRMGLAGGLGAQRRGFGGVSAPPGNPPVNSVRPALTHPTPLRVGNTVSTNNGTWSNSPTGFAYRWFADSAVISGATTSSYVVAISDGGKALNSEVTATNADGSGVATSLLSPAVEGPPVNTAAPVVTYNDLYPDNVLLTNNGTWTNSPTGYAYQWVNSISGNIVGAIANNYIINVSDIGANVHCVVTATNAAGSTPASSNSNKILWSPKALSNIQEWVDVSYDPSVTEDTGKIVQLSDRSGNGWHFTQTDALKRFERSASTVFSRKTAKLLAADPNDPFMNAVIPTTYTGSVACFLVVAMIDHTLTDSGGKVIAFTAAGASDSAAGSMVPLQQPALNVQVRTSASGANVTMGGTSLQPIVWIAEQIATGLRARRNGGGWNLAAAQIAQSFSFVRGTINTNILAGGPSGVRVQGEFAESLMIINAEPTETDIDKLIGYAAWKWGPNCVALLPVGFPYKDAPP